jgi:RNA polymerase-binding transcription factor DksA
MTPCSRLAATRSKSSGADSSTSSALRDRAERALAEIDAALARLAGGRYGLCTNCGRAVAPERLEALPWAAHCIDCQRELGRAR